MSIRPENPNLEQLIDAAAKLKPLLDQIVFVGGCATGLLLTDPGAAPVRPTLDVDAIIAIASYAEFTFIENRLRSLGFRESRTEGAPICRWLNGDLILDLMPTDPAILGFSNRWYQPALENARKIRVGDHEIKLIAAPYFIATKLEAFHRRGNNDYQMSRDLEDIVTVIDGRVELIDEISTSDPELRRHLSGEFRSLLSNREFLDALPGHLLPDAASQQRITIVMARIEQIINTRE
jgi:predicted nucleotidyltransferase